MMPLKRAVLFIDGSNFYHALKSNNLYDLFDYGNFFKELSKKYRIEKAYYYDALKNIDIEPQRYSGQQSFHTRLTKEIPIITFRTRPLRYIRGNELIDQARKKAKFCKECDAKIPSFLADAHLSKLSKEKGIDIMLVTDMVQGAFQNRYDVALLATGDADFVPAVQLVQNLKKEVVNLHFYAGSSSELRNTCNSHILVKVDAKGKCTF